MVVSQCELNLKTWTERVSEC